MFPSWPGIAPEDGRKRPGARPSRQGVHRPCPPQRDARRKAGHDGVLVATLALIALLGIDLAHSEIPLVERRSGYDQMSPATKAMQDDDTSNPASLAVLDGEALWKRKAGSADKSCADCH